MNMTFLVNIVQGFAILILAPLVAGMLHWVRSRLSGRRAPMPWQYTRTLLKLLAKTPVVPDTASWVFYAAPLIVFTCYAAPGFLLPLLWLPDGDGYGVGDLVLVIYLISFARFALGLAGLDTGASLGGLGSSRELLTNLLAEPNLILIAFALAAHYNTTDLALIVKELGSGPTAIYLEPSFLMLLVPAFIITLAEAGRLPFDNPHGTLELPMLGRSIHLEYSGPLLALLEWGEALRITFFLLLLLNLFFPWSFVGTDLAVPGNFMLLVMKLFIALILIAVWEGTWIKLPIRALFLPALLSLIFAVAAGVLKVMAG